MTIGRLGQIVCLAKFIFCVIVSSPKKKSNSSEIKLKLKLFAYWEEAHLVFKISRTSSLDLSLMIQIDLFGHAIISVFAGNFKFRPIVRF
jgi:hypothetical protein